jgi:hypothetical protein
LPDQAREKGSRRTDQEVPRVHAVRPGTTVGEHPLLYGAGLSLPRPGDPHGVCPFARRTGRVGCEGAAVRRGLHAVSGMLRPDPQRGESPCGHDGRHIVHRAGCQTGH